MTKPLFETFGQLWMFLGCYNIVYSVTHGHVAKLGLLVLPICFGVALPVALLLSPVVIFLLSLRSRWTVARRPLRRIR